MDGNRESVVVDKGEPRPARVVFHCPCPPDSAQGNAISAHRVVDFLEELGCAVEFSADELVVDELGVSFDVAIAQNAYRSREWVASIQQRVPTIVVVSGTELLASREELADLLGGCARVVVCCDEILSVLPEAVWAKTVVVPKSCVLPVDWELEEGPRRRPVITVMGHARKVKRPLLAAIAAERLPPESMLRVELMGKILEPGFRELISNTEAAHSRFRWVGELPRKAALERLRTSLGTVNSSIVEGGANSIAEAILLGVPVLATRLPANIGFLGRDHPGLFEIDDANRLTELMSRLETDSGFRDELLAHQELRKPQFAPELERAGWARLLRSVL